MDDNKVGTMDYCSNGTSSFSFDDAGWSCWMMTMQGVFVSVFVYFRDSCATACRLLLFQIHKACDV